MSLKFAKQEQDALKIISDQPGITSNNLAAILAQASGTTPQQMRGMLSNAAAEHKFVRVKTSDNNRFTYKCYMTVPPGVDPKLFEPRRSPVKKNGKVVTAGALATPTQAEQAYVRSIPQGVGEGLADLFDEPAHPAVKPGTFTIDLELPDGNKATFTLDEARRMYEQLYRLFGAHGL